MPDYDSKEITQQVKDMLGIFNKVGIAPAGRFFDAPQKYHPSNVMPDFRSIIVYIEGKKTGSDNVMGGFSDFLGTIAAQSEVVEYLNSLGYRAKIIDGCSSQISLVQAGVEAGIGERSPVNSLVVKDFGLTASIGAIITDAVLMGDDKVINVCIGCMKCLEVCPIRDEPYIVGDLNKCACGKCSDICPV